MTTGTTGVFELAEKHATAVTSGFPLPFNSAVFVSSAPGVKSSKLCDHSDLAGVLNLSSSLKV